MTEGHYVDPDVPIFDPEPHDGVTEPDDPDDIADDSDTPYDERPEGLRKAE